MPELVVVERLQPCLLDRLTDDDPKNSLESRAQRVISLQRYRQGVLRDLGWLFNASAHLPHEGQHTFSIEDYPQALRSVINFGVRHLFGITAPNMRELERQLTDALYTFEPRIVRNSLKVRSRDGRERDRPRSGGRSLGRSRCPNDCISRRTWISNRATAAWGLSAWTSGSSVFITPSCGICAR
jgi:type VI secretion system protein ImpF